MDSTMRKLGGMLKRMVRRGLHTAIFGAVAMALLMVLDVVLLDGGGDSEGSAHIQ